MSRAAKRTRPRQKRKRDHPAYFARTIHGESLGPSLPSLEILYTNDSQEISKWINEHALKDELSCIGLDTESKPCFTREQAMNSKGPDVLQLATANGKCLVIHLSRIEHLDLWKRNIKTRQLADLQDEACLKGLVHLQKVLCDRNIAKAGIGLREDAFELFENHSIEMNCRMELTVIEELEKMAESSALDEAGSEEEAVKRPQNLKGIAEYYVPGLVVPKRKKLQMSNWGAHSLKDAQVVYAASDAFVAAAVVARVTSSSNDADDKYCHTLETLIQHVLKDEKTMEEVRQERQRKKKKKKKEKATKKRKSVESDQKQNAIDRPLKAARF